jgi:hypothetical protein
MITPSKYILSFYSGQPSGDSARSLEDIWKFNDDELEGYHTYIQWLFPLLEPSAFNFAAPVLDADVIFEFRKSHVLQQRLLISYKVMLKFYGFEIDESDNDIKVIKSTGYADKKKNWISYRNHNFLRITRILTSLRLLGLERYSNPLSLREGGVPEYFSPALNRFTRKNQKKSGVLRLIIGENRKYQPFKRPAKAFPTQILMIFCQQLRSVNAPAGLFPVKPQ